LDETAIALLAELESLGIAAKEEKGEVYLKPVPPQRLMGRLRANKQALADALWKKAGRERQRAAVARLTADRQAWIQESKRLEVYRGPR
jgi:hypothetical protein